MFARSEYFHLTKENFSNVIGNTSRKPIFVFFWASWCQHCKHFHPTWDEFKDREHSFDLAEIECESNRLICSNYSKNGFPNLIWFDSSLKSNGDYIYAKYTGGQSIEALTEFCEKQKHFPLKIINESEKTDIIQRQNTSRTSKFFFTFNNEKQVEVAKSIAYHFRDEMCEFYLIYSNHTSEETKIEACNRQNHLKLFTKEFEENEIKKFVFVNMYLYMQELNINIDKAFAQQKEPLIAFIGSNYEYDEEKKKTIIEILENVSEVTPVFYINCSHLQFFCRYTFTYKKDESEAMTNILILWDKGKNLFWPKNNIISYNETMSWFNDSISGKIKGKGPGNGLLSNIIAFFWDSYAESMSNFVIMCSIPFLVVTTLLMAYLSSNRENVLVKELKEKNE